ncbi:MAG: tRNA (adenosine(37)-N6)-dimethylallyltransferase MiaA [Candidatus Cloacimonadota bacterium]|nr:MAG: tRNA (adenosine(37)-N6)-dimethylallyltransferase MiaA [Candidatus Cloacimonadota bacterium]RLC57895.1 MAG: tRNA (adenosine(37)-N6)-dimethylallyltransferase MiaA [Candidatus Cloacimonadota bacterium]
MIPLIVIQGPTGAGKSAFAFNLAEKLNTEIISADSRQIYKLLNIGTAKPSIEEQKQIKHHLIDIINPDAEYSAGDFARDAKEIISKLHKNNKIPIIAGGTGFYIKALLDGIFKSPDVPRELRKKLADEASEKGSEFLYNRLAEVDMDSAGRVDPNDLNRIIRALEIYEFTGKTITQLWKEKPADNFNYNVFNILINQDRKLLYDKIDLRVDEMIKEGLLDEIKHLFQLGYSPECSGFNTVGYKELLPYFLNGADLDFCIKMIKQHTRNYAKRQLTWYRRISFDLTLDKNDINISKVIELINNNLEENK